MKSDYILFHAAFFIIIFSFFLVELLDSFTAKRGEKGERKGEEKAESIKRAMEKTVSKIYGSYMATERL